jgi:hypothetical protein
VDDHHFSYIRKLKKKKTKKLNTYFFQMQKMEEKNWNKKPTNELKQTTMKRKKTHAFLASIVWFYVLNMKKLIIF